ncbi:MAG TPA: sodium:solute symporter family protein [Candidatus Omnitrophota bacterium]|nr:MAG: Sodium/glucose cotransporter [Candidatus Omnitrophica bacterium ADurb.Bin314]HOE69168.1 sodium:solute symporter family protein [Candidatus Omnitrophota bacterium]HQB93902.1 sodium:solute symporter family protein [Candidatus Omnitrophota bacterium]
MTSSQIWLLSSVALYILFMLGIGFWTSRRIHNTKDYIVAGGKMGWWFSLGTIFATWFGAETCMGASRTAFDKGILGVIADPFGAGLCLILAGLFFAKTFHNLKAETIIDFFEARYGKKVGIALSFLYIPVYLGWVGGQLLAFGIILHALIGIPVMPAVLLSTAVVVLYTYWGGMWADAVTDLYQMIFVLLGLLVLFPILLHDLGGFSSIVSRIPASYFQFYPRHASGLTWLNYIQAWMMVGIGSLPAQDLFQRLMAPKSGTMAKWASITAGLMYIVIGLIPVLLGIFGRLAIPASSGESILIDLAQKYLPTPLMALMVGALLSAIMSSADSALLAPAGIIGHNIVPYLKPDADDALQLKWCHWSILIVGVLSLILALYFRNIYALCMHAWGILLVGVAAPMIAGVYWKRATSQGAVAGAVGGTGAWILATLYWPEGYPAHLFGFVISCLTLVSVSLLTAPHSEVRSRSRFK